MKAITTCTKYFPVLLFIKGGVLPFSVQNEVLKYDNSFKWKLPSNKQCFPVMLFIMLYKVVLTFESVDEILKCDHSNESYWAVLSRDAVYYAV